MANVQFANAVAGTIGVAMSSVQTSMTVTLAPFSGPFPTVSSPTYFYATIVDQYSYTNGINPPQQREIVKVTLYTGSGAMTVVRGFEGTTQYAWAVGDRVELRLTNQGIIDSVGAGTAPAAATYVTIANESGTLANSRRLAAGTGITQTDGGAGSTLTTALTNMAANSLKGNNTGGVAAPVDLTVAQTNTMLGTLTNALGAVSIAVGTDAGKPAFGTSGRLYVTTDTGILYRDTGAAWTIEHPALTGDVTTAVGNLATTIAANSVTNAKMATMAGNTIKGNNTGGAAVPSDLTVAQVNAMLGISANTTLNTPYNVIINGNFMVNQRTATNISLSASPVYVADKWTCWFSAGSAVSGNVATGGALSVNGRFYAASASGLNGTGTTQLSFRTRIESRDAARLVNTTASFSCLVLQNTGASQTCVVVIRKPTTIDNYGAVTVIGTSGGTVVTNNTSTPVTFTGVSMGDCSNGIEVEVQIPLGTTPVGKTVGFTEAVLAEGSAAPIFPYLLFEDELFRCKRYFQKSHNYATTPAAANAQVMYFYAPKAGAVASTFQIPLPVQARSSSGTTTTYNAQAAGAQVCRASDGAVSTVTTVAAVFENIIIGTYTGNAGYAVGDQLQLGWSYDCDL